MVSSGLALGPARRAAGAVLLAVSSAAITLALLPHRNSETYAVPVLLMLLAVVLSAAVGGVWVGIPGAVAGFLVLNWFFTPPYNTLTIGSGHQAVVLVVYLATAAVVSAITGIASRRESEAARARAEAQALSSLAGAALSKQETLTGLLDRVREVFAFDSVELRERTATGWRTVETVGAPTGEPAQQQEVPAGPDLLLAVSGPELFGRDQRLLSTFADAAATALEGRQLAQRAAEAAAYEAADRTRAALLTAVGHDLRTPLSALRAAHESLRQTEIDWTPKERDELLDMIGSSTARLHALVDNLLDASRLEAGVVSMHPCEVGLLEVCDRALLAVDTDGRVHVELDESLPAAWADPGLAERIVANVLQNALRYSPAGTIVTVTGSADDRTVRCDVIDHGPGLPRDRRKEMFMPFQRLGDRSHEGLGLGLSVALGFAQVMGGELLPLDTPGGGLTMRLILPRADA